MSVIDSAFRCVVTTNWAFSPRMRFLAAVNSSTMNCSKRFNRCQAIDHTSSETSNIEIRIETKCIDDTSDAPSESMQR